MTEQKPTAEAMEIAGKAWRATNYGMLNGGASVELIALAIDAHTNRLREQLRLAVEWGAALRALIQDPGEPHKSAPSAKHLYAIEGAEQALRDAGVDTDQQPATDARVRGVGE